MAGFEGIIGHKEIVTHLEDAVRQKKISHAYILQGEQGAGKKTIAGTFAGALQCTGDGKRPCGFCASCKQAASGNHPDIIEVRHEKPNTIGVEDIRTQLTEDVRIRPYSSEYKIYIVPDAEKMTVQAQNALLKTLEEPPEYAVILLLAANAQALLPTVLSRCVLLTMRPLPDALIEAYLMEKLQLPDYQAQICTAFAQGNIGKAVTLAGSEHFNEIKSSAVQLLAHIDAMEFSGIMAAVKEIQDYKVDIGDYLDLFSVWYRDVLYFKATSDAGRIIFRENIQSIREQASRISYEGIESILQGLSKAKTRLNANVNFDLTMELLFLLIKENF